MPLNTPAFAKSIQIRNAHPNVKFDFKVTPNGKGLIGIGHTRYHSLYGYDQEKHKEFRTNEPEKTILVFIKDDKAEVIQHELDIHDVAATKNRNKNNYQDWQVELIPANGQETEHVLIWSSASSGYEGVFIYDINKGEKISTTLTSTKAPISKLSVFPDGKRLRIRLASWRTGTAGIEDWDIEDRKSPKQLALDEEFFPAEILYMLPDKVHYIGLQHTTLSEVTPDPFGRPVVIPQTKKLTISGYTDEKAATDLPQTMQLDHANQVWKEGYRCFAATSDGKYLVAGTRGSSDKVLDAFDVSDFYQPIKFAMDKGFVTNVVAISADGKYVAVSYTDEEQHKSYVALWNIADRTQKPIKVGSFALNKRVDYVSFMSNSDVTTAADNFVLYVDGYKDGLLTLADFTKPALQADAKSAAAVAADAKANVANLRLPGAAAPAAGAGAGATVQLAPPAAGIGNVAVAVNKPAPTPSAAAKPAGPG